MNRAFLLFSHGSSPAGEFDCLEAVCTSTNNAEVVARRKFNIPHWNGELPSLVTPDADGGFVHYTSVYVTPVAMDVQIEEWFEVRT